MNKKVSRSMPFGGEFSKTPVLKKAARSTRARPIKKEGEQMEFTPDQKKDWKQKIHSDEWIKKFMNEMDRLETGCQMVFSLKDPKSGKVVLMETLENNSYKVKKK